MGLYLLFTSMFCAEEKMHVEYFQMLVHLFEATQFDNMKIMRAMIYIKDDLLPLEVGTTQTRVCS